MTWQPAMGKAASGQRALARELFGRAVGAVEDDDLGYAADLIGRAALYLATTIPEGDMAQAWIDDVAGQVAAALEGEVDR